MREARIVVEITWPVPEEDLRKRHAGDASVDFAARSFNRCVRHILDELEDRTRGNWHLIELPHFLDERKPHA